MKKLGLLALMLLPFAAVTAAETDKPKKPEEHLLVLRIERGKSATFTLRENVTTGFQWMAQYDPKLCRVEIAHRGPENPGGAPTCGAPGQAVVSVWLLTEAPADLVLEYRRPWEKDAPPAKVLYYAVVPQK